MPKGVRHSTEPQTQFPLRGRTPHPQRAKGCKCRVTATGSPVSSTERLRFAIVEPAAAGNPHCREFDDGPADRLGEAAGAGDSGGSRTPACRRACPILRCPSVAGAPGPRRGLPGPFPLFAADLFPARARAPGLFGVLLWAGECARSGHRRPPAPGMWQDIGDRRAEVLLWRWAGS